MSCRVIPVRGDVHKLLTYTDDWWNNPSRIYLTFPHLTEPLYPRELLPWYRTSKCWWFTNSFPLLIFPVFPFTFSYLLGPPYTVDWPSEYTTLKSFTRVYISLCSLWPQAREFFPLSNFWDCSILIFWQMVRWGQNFRFLS